MGKLAKFKARARKESETVSGEEIERANLLQDNTTIATKTTKAKKKIYQNDVFLPPCRVCGGKASGHHFGAITCEACKVFFRRSLSAANYVSGYKCARDGNCEIHSQRRKTCSFCRLKKCHDVGMSKEGVQKGRYTLSKKSDCIRLAKGQDLEHVSCNNSPAANSNLSSINSPREISNNNPQGGSSRQFFRTPEQIQFYDNIIQQVVEADAKYTIVTPEFILSKPEKEAANLEHFKLEQSIFGLKPIPNETYQALYKETGLDVDGRRHALNRCMSCSESIMKKLIGFIKSIPGFKMFDLDDQVELTKISNIYWILFGTIPCWNTEKRLYTCAICMDTYTLAHLERFYSSQYLENLFKFFEQVQSLQFLPEELTLVKTFAMLTTDEHAEKLKNRSIIEQQQLTFLDTLVYLLEKTRPQDPIAIARIMQMLTAMRNFQNELKIEVQGLFKDFPDLEIPQLTYEILDGQYELSKFSSLKKIPEPDSTENGDSSYFQVADSSLKTEPVDTEGDTLVTMDTMGSNPYLGH